MTFLCVFKSFGRGLMVISMSGLSMFDFAPAIAELADKPKVKSPCPRYPRCNDSMSISNGMLTYKQPDIQQ